MANTIDNIFNTVSMYIISIKRDKTEESRLRDTLHIIYKSRDHQLMDQLGDAVGQKNENELMKLLNSYCMCELLRILS